MWPEIIFGIVFIILLYKYSGIGHATHKASVGEVTGINVYPIIGLRPAYIQEINISKSEKMMPQWVIVAKEAPTKAVEIDQYPTLGDIVFDLSRGKTVMTHAPTRKSYELKSMTADQIAKNNGNQILSINAKVAPYGDEILNQWLSSLCDAAVYLCQVAPESIIYNRSSNYEIPTSCAISTDGTSEANFFHPIIHVSSKIHVDKWLEVSLGSVLMHKCFEYFTHLNEGKISIGNKVEVVKFL